jgi:hypothetical protein
LLKTVVDTGVPALVFFAMVVVGIEPTADGFRRVARQLGTVVAATAAERLLLPVTGRLLVRCLSPLPAIARCACDRGMPPR